MVTDLGRLTEALAKAELAREIAMLIAKRGLSQAAAADVLKIGQRLDTALLQWLDWGGSARIELHAAVIR